MKFVLESDYEPAGGQPQVIKELAEGFKKHDKQTLLGITGSGKTFVMANIIEKTQLPTLILAHNKTLAAQLYSELKSLFPKNRVEYFISYYDYYQPESYIAQTDTYIEKEAQINEQIEKMRLHSTASLLSRNDVIIVSSISCIYGLGNPHDFWNLSLSLKRKEKKKRADILKMLVDMQYERTTVSLEQGKMRVRGDVIEVFPAYDDTIIRIELFGDEIERITELNPVTSETITEIDEIRIFPARQYVAPEEKIEKAITEIKEELKENLPNLGILERERLSKRVRHDIEMMREMGYCSGIENYSRHFDGRKKGEPPYVLLDYFPKDYLLIIDESHQTLPQSRAMYNGDRARKQSLIENGFRLDSAYDNRPLKFDEFVNKWNKVLFVSATPSQYEFDNSSSVSELIIRPTGLLDPIVELRKTKGQIDDLLIEIKKMKEKDFRTLVTTLTKRMAEDLTDYLAKKDIKVRYLHSDIESLDRIELIRQLRAGDFDVLCGINLLREGLDIPEVALVAILDADKEGFLRDERSLIQTIGRAARNNEGKVILYADKETESIKKAMKITRYRRLQQIAHNKKNNIIPTTIIKEVPKKYREIKGTKHLPKDELRALIAATEAEMRLAAEQLDFEKAIDMRDKLLYLQSQEENRE
jgi:excinuclease ABC subunit B